MSALAKIEPKQTLIEVFADRFNVDKSEVSKILKSTAFKVKDGQVTDEQMTALMVIANEHKLNPFTREIYAYPDKGGIVPVVGVDGWTRIMNEHPQFDGVEFKFSDDKVTHKGKNCHEWIECIITRKDRAKPIVVREYFDEVVRTPNFPTPWDSHPKRMHRHKTLIQCVRVAFGFSGIYDEDEAERIMEKDITPPKESQPEPEPKPREVVFYSEEEFSQNKAAWKKVIENGKSPDQFIGFIESRGKRFTESQKEEIRGWDKQPIVVEGEASRIDDDFLNAYEAEEGKGE